MADTSKIVAVTGAAGYIGSWVVKTLLDAGYHVRGSVRNLQDTVKVTHLKTLFPQIELFEADLLAEGSFDSCFQDCVAVFHTASPFQLVVEDPQRDLVDPALKGTLNVLKSCHNAGVKRVILTSSVAAVVGDKAEPGQVFTEADWNNDSTLASNPYRYSKATAERAAWDFAREHDLQLTVINPSFVIGRPLSDRADSTSVLFALKALRGETVMGLALACVAVADVALAHLRALERPESIGKRFIVASEDQYAARALLGILKNAGFSQIDPETQVPVQAPLSGLKMSNQQAREVLGISLAPVEETFVDMARGLIELGLFSS